MSLVEAKIREERFLPILNAEMKTTGASGAKFYWFDMASSPENFVRWQSADGL